MWYEWNKRRNVKIFKMITRINKVEAMAKHISCDFKWKFNSARCHPNQTLNNDMCKCQCKKYRCAKKPIAGILAHVFVIIVNI